MALRALVFQVVVVLLGVVTLGLGWLYCVGAALGGQSAHAVRRVVARRAPGAPSAAVH